jgi:hypothetical protein
MLIYLLASNKAGATQVQFDATHVLLSFDRSRPFQKYFFSAPQFVVDLAGPSENSILFQTMV